MSFTRQSIALKDLENCLAITRDGFAYNPVLKKRLLALWKELVGKNNCITVLIEDRRLPAQNRVVGFGMSVFITDAFAQNILKGGPFLSRDFLTAFEKGERPYLLKKEISEANAGEGLNLLVLHHGWNEAVLSPEDLGKIRLMQSESFIQQHAGYQVKEYLQEVYSRPVLDFVLRAGSVLRNDFKAPRWKKLVKGTSPDNWPYLTGFKPAEVLARAGTAASLFQSKTLKPRFGFSAGEQDMLGKALLGETDEQLAKSLGLSQWTIKKRWQAVYLKTTKADPELLRNEKAPSPKDQDRGRQKRRRLLEYLRQHPEELRPNAARPR